MNKEIQEKLKNMGKTDPVKDVVKTILKSQAKCCVRAKVKLDEMEKNEK
jgi:hypothetical protein